MIVRLILINSILMLLILGNPETANIKAAVATNLRATAQEIAASFKQKDQNAVLSLGARGESIKRIPQTSSFQLFLSADRSRPSRSIENGLTLPESRFIYPTSGLTLSSSSANFENGAERFKKPALVILSVPAAPPLLHGLRRTGTC